MCMVSNVPLEWDGSFHMQNKNEIVASGVQTCSVVRNHIKNPSVVVTDLVTFSTPAIDLSYFCQASWPAGQVHSKVLKGQP